MRKLNDSSVSIVGLGLMGGSLAGALRGRCREVVGLARRPETVAQALAAKLINRGGAELAAGVQAADIVVLATPVRTILRQLAEIGPLLPNGCLLLDLGSTKTQITAAMQKLPAHIQPLGGHPMCGKELAGLAAADPDLYRGNTFILCPLERTSPEALALGQELARAVGAKPLVLSAERQDFLVGTVSHLPYLLACGLVGTADATTSADPAAWEIIAGGFRDTSRVAGSDVTMMTDILLTNQTLVLEAVQTFQGQLEHLAQMVETGNENALKTALGWIKATRKEMFP